MNFKTPTPIIRAAIVAVLVLIIGYTGLDIPRSAIEQAVDEQLESLSNLSADSTTNNQNKIFITSVIDGDTAIAVIDGREEKLRFVGIDTPETEFSPAGLECFGNEATEYAKQLLENKTVTQSADSTQDDRDRYERLLVYVTLENGEGFGEVMIREGYAREFTYDNTYEHQSTYMQAESDEKQFYRGLWGVCEI